MASARVWFQMILAGTVLCVGGPALVMYVSPAPGELFKKFNPELQKRNLESREQRKQDFEDFITKLKEYSKSDKPIWVVAAEDEARTRANKEQEQRKIAAAIQKRREETKKQSMSGQ